jgi:hypothetical protein
MRLSYLSVYRQTKKVEWMKVSRRMNDETLKKLLASIEPEG